MLDALYENRWMLFIRGIFAVIFGLMAIILPGLTLTALVLLFGLYVLVDGAITAYVAFSNQNYNRWWIGLIEGVVGIIAGVLTFVWPSITGIVLLYLIAFWAVATGILEIWASTQVEATTSARMLLGLSGIISLAFGIIMALSPVSGALAVAWLIGIYAVSFGVLMVGVAFGLLSDSNFQSTDDYVPNV